MTGLGFGPPVFDEVVHDVLDRSNLAGEERALVERILMQRIRRNAPTPATDAPGPDFVESIETLLGELAPVDEGGYALAREQLTAARVAGVISELCRRRVLPWPICPARD